MVTPKPCECQWHAPFGFIRSRPATNRTAPTWRGCRPPGPSPAQDPLRPRQARRCRAGRARVCGPRRAPGRRPGSARRAHRAGCRGRRSGPYSSARAPVHTSPVKSSSPPLSLSPRRSVTHRRNISCSSSCSPRSHCDVLGLLREERVEARLGRARRVQPPLHAEPLDQAVEPETLADHPDRPDERRGVRVDLVGRTGEPVAAGCRDVFAERQHRHLAPRRRARGCGRRRARTAWATRPAS